MAAGLLDEAVDLQRPRPVPWPSALVVKKGSKACASNLLRHPRAGVAHGDHHILARAKARLCGGVALVEEGVGRLDRELAAVGHGVARVDREVEQARFRAGSGRPATAPEPRAPARSRCSMCSPSVRLEQVGHGADQTVEVDRLGLERLPAREGEQARGQARRAVGCMARHVQRTADADHVGWLAVARLCRDCRR